MCFRVSIPYRLATNEAIAAYSFTKRELFQFLIGWLQTIMAKKKFEVATMFQFLIGWLQTINDNSSRFTTIMFQFLIGWLQTQELVGYPSISVFVSIPYRLATNRNAKATKNLLVLVSIPYRLATNTQAL